MDCHFPPAQWFPKWALPLPGSCEYHGGGGDIKVGDGGVVASKWPIGGVDRKQLLIFYKEMTKQCL